MPGCCASPFAIAANEQFDRKMALRELKRYRQHGPGATARLLADGIARAGSAGGTLLDVGSGVGALTLTLLERGAPRAVAVDASRAYLDAAREEASRRRRAQAIQFVHADFVEAASQLPPAATVALDRVVCCYPSWERLLDAALVHAERCLALSYPRDKWYVRLNTMLENGQRRLTRNSFRTFVHPVGRMEETIARAGFRLASRRETWIWSVDVYVR